MSNILKLIDYLFYRIYHFYQYRNDSTPVWAAVLVLSVMLNFTLLTIVVFFSLIKHCQVSNNIKILIVVPLVFFPLILWKKYNKSQTVEQLVSHYKDEAIGTKRLRGWLFVFYLILVLLIPISIGYMRHNLGMDI